MIILGVWDPNQVDFEAKALYIGFICYIAFSLFWGQMDLFVFTVSRNDKPILYWIALLVLAAVAIYLAKRIFR